MPKFQETLGAGSPSAAGKVTLCCPCHIIVGFHQITSTKFNGFFASSLHLVSQIHNNLQILSTANVLHMDSPLFVPPSPILPVTPPSGPQLQRWPQSSPRRSTRPSSSTRATSRGPSTRWTETTREALTFTDTRICNFIYNRQKYYIIYLNLRTFQVI